MSVSEILRAVNQGRITPEQAAILLEMRRDMALARRRRAFWRGVLDGFSLGPLRRWIARRVH